MLTLLSISVNRTEFLVRGVADTAKGYVRFQGLVNGKVFVENKDYDKVRTAVVNEVCSIKPKEEMH